MFPKTETASHKNWTQSTSTVLSVAARCRNETLRYVGLFDVFDVKPSGTFLFTGGYSPVVAKSADGKLWFVPLGDASVIDPYHLPVNKLPPPVNIEQITADDKTYDATNGLRLPPRVRNLAIDYTALSLVAPEKVRFRFKLEGQNRKWHEVVNDREVQYTNVGPGTYRFRVLACNNSGVWNEEGATLDFVILPTWYQTNLVLRPLRGCFPGITVGGVSVAGAAIGGAVQYASGREGSRAHTNCSGPA